jgi:hypothetical protein
VRGLCRLLKTRFVRTFGSDGSAISPSSWVTM